jgi:penicillin-binding protein 1A
MKWLIRFLALALTVILTGTIVGFAGMLGAYWYLEPELPDAATLRDVRLQVPLRVYSSDGGLIAEFGEKRRLPLAYEEIPPRLIQAFLAAEDDRFREHSGVDYQGLARAAVELLLTGQKRQGGSTITMQVARNFFLTREKTYTRKLKEIFLALRIERELSKNQILELYLNKIYMGNRAYGIGAAARVYYGSTVDRLTLPQMAMIAGLPKAPSRFNPIADAGRALVRRDYVLRRMRELDFISEEEFQDAVATPITAELHLESAEVEAPYFAEMVRAEMLERFGNDAYTSGLTVYTTLDSRLQAAANRALREALQAYDLRHGYRGPEQKLDLQQITDEKARDRVLSDAGQVGDLLPALVTDVKEKSATLYLGEGDTIELEWRGIEWARKHVNENRVGAKPKSAGETLAAGDLVRIVQVQTEDQPYWRLSQIPQIEGALVSLRPQDGAVLALVGGFDFYRSKFNRAVQAQRQPGSGFKAFIYSAALENGFTPATLVNDAPVVFRDPSLEDTWRPENYSGKFFGPTRLRKALTKSRNLVSIRVLRTMGIRPALEHIKRFGFDTDQLPHNLSLALGSGVVTPLMMARGYSVLANGGFLVDPYFVERIMDADGTTLFAETPLSVCEGPERAPGQTMEASATEEQEIAPAPAPLPQPETIAGESEAPGLPETAAARCAPRVISAQNAYLMNSMMRDVIMHGTARRARSLGRKDLAGKTGTTNEQRDAWFSGFNQGLVAVTWVGFDSSDPLGKGETGGRAALPAWISYMGEALKSEPENPLPKPPDLVTVRIDPKTGLAARADQSNAIFEIFRVDHAPEPPPLVDAVSGESTSAGTQAPEASLF